MKKAFSPLIAAVLGVVLGLGTGVYTFWRASNVVMDHAVNLAPRAVKQVAEEKERGWDFWTIEIENLANELKGERERLQKESEQIAHREVQLKSERLELDKVRKDIEQLREEIRSKIIEVNADESKNIRQLATTYASLTPRAAVAIIRELDDVMAIKILSFMKPDIISPIFEEMSRTPGPDGTLARRAAQLSDRIRLLKSAKTAANP